MTTRKLVARIKRKKGYLYFVDGEGRIWEQELNKGKTKKILEKMEIEKEKKDNERYF